MKKQVEIVAICLAFCVAHTEGHGRLLDPPSRSTMWRFGYGTPANYDDNQLYCGGKTVQWSTFGGKCGPCGDSWGEGNFGENPRPNEAGGRYGTGRITRIYQQASTVETVVQLTASHLGFFEFKLCPTNDKKKRSNATCFNANPVQVYGRNDYKYYVDKGSVVYNITLQLPKDLHCKHCVFLWRYQAGNSWGKCPNGTRRLGCGAQEEFRGCADVKITKSKRPMPSNFDLDYICTELSDNMLTRQRLTCDKIRSLENFTCTNSSCRSLTQLTMNFRFQCDDLTDVLERLRGQCDSTSCYSKVFNDEYNSTADFNTEQTTITNFFNLTTEDNSEEPSIACELCNSPFSRYVKLYSICRTGPFGFNNTGNFTDVPLCNIKLISLCYMISSGKLNLEDICLKNSTTFLDLHESCSELDMAYEVQNSLCGLGNSSFAQKICKSGSIFGIPGPCETTVHEIDVNEFSELCEGSFPVTLQKNTTMSGFCDKESPESSIKGSVCKEFENLSQMVTSISTEIAGISKKVIFQCKNGKSNDQGHLCKLILTQNLQLINRIKSMYLKVPEESVILPTESPMIKYRCKYSFDNRLRANDSEILEDDVSCTMVTGEEGSYTDFEETSYQVKDISHNGHHGPENKMESDAADAFTTPEILKIPHRFYPGGTVPMNLADLNKDNDIIGTFDSEKLSSVLGVQVSENGSSDDVVPISVGTMLPEELQEENLNHQSNLSVDAFTTPKIPETSDSAYPEGTEQKKLSDLGADNDTIGTFNSERLSSPNLTASQTAALGDEISGNESSNDVIPISVGTVLPKELQEENLTSQSNLAEGTFTTPEILKTFNPTNFTNLAISQTSQAAHKIPENGSSVSAIPISKGTMRPEELQKDNLDSSQPELAAQVEVLDVEEEVLTGELTEKEIFENEIAETEYSDKPMKCVPKGLWRFVADMDLWCRHNCASESPNSACLHHCQCDDMPEDILRNVEFT